jgi:peptidoglycan hydrolase-like protein with peptidoglycan-binding domain
VESAILEQVVAATGTVAPGRSYGATAAPEQTDAVVTATPLDVGERARFGDVLIEVSGRPIVLLRGELPAYRDLRPGDEGPDVRQLQEALRELGLYAGAGSGEYGPATAAGVSRLYRTLARQPREIGVQEATSAQVAVRAAVRAEQEAAIAADLAQSATGAQRRATLRALRYAREDLALAQQELRTRQRESGPTLPASEVLFVPRGPVTVLALRAGLGERVDGSPIQVAAGEPHVEASLPESAAALVKRGQAARVKLAGDAAARAATVTRLSRATPDSDQESLSEDEALAQLRLDDPPAPAAVGTAVDVVIVTASTGSEVLTVPVTALRYTTASGATVQTRSGEVVDVEVGMVADGRAQVSAPDLRPGTDVRIGDPTSTGPS